MSFPGSSLKPCGATPVEGGGQKVLQENPGFLQQQPLVVPLSRPAASLWLKHTQRHQQHLCVKREAPATLWLVARLSARGGAAAPNTSRKTRRCSFAAATSELGSSSRLGMKYTNAKKIKARWNSERNQRLSSLSSLHRGPPAGGRSQELRSAQVGRSSVNILAGTSCPAAVTVKVSTSREGSC